MEFAAQAGIRPTRTNQTPLTRHDVHFAPAPPNESPPRRTKKPDERAKTSREAEQAPVSANAYNKRNKELPRDITFATTFH